MGCPVRGFKVSCSARETENSYRLLNEDSVQSFASLWHTILFLHLPPGTSNVSELLCWCCRSSAVGAAEVEAVIESQVIFDPIVSPELNPAQTDVVIAGPEKAPPKASIWGAAFAGARMKAKKAEASTVDNAAFEHAATGAPPEEGSTAEGAADAPEGAPGTQGEPREQFAATRTQSDAMTSTAGGTEPSTFDCVDFLNVLPFICIPHCECVRNGSNPVLK